MSRALRPQHATKRITYGKWSEDVDIGLAGIVLDLWHRRIETTSSCQEIDGEAYVQFPHARAAYRFVRLIQPTIEGFRWFTCLRDYEWGKGWVEIHFPSTDIRRVKRATRQDKARRTLKSPHGKGKRR